MFVFGNIALRQIEFDDLEVVRNIRNDQSTWENLSVVGMITREQQELWYKKMAQSSDKKYYVVVSESNVVGVVRTDEIDWVNKSIRVGVDIDMNCRRKGYGTATYKAIKEYFFNYMNFNRIWLEVLETNSAGIGLYKKVGFIEEGRKRQAVYRKGRYIDYVIMSILKCEI